MRLPPIYARGRRLLVWRLCAYGLLHAVISFAMALTLHAALHGGGRGRASVAFLLILAAAGLAVRLAEGRDAEMLGQEYVLRVRSRLLQSLTARSLRSRARERWGVSMSRLVNDLSSLRSWVSLGFARGVSGSVSLLGLLARSPTSRRWWGLRPPVWWRCSASSPCFSARGCERAFVPPVGSAGGSRTRSGRRCWQRRRCATTARRAESFERSAVAAVSSATSWWPVRFDPMRSGHCRSSSSVWCSPRFSSSRGPTPASLRSARARRSWCCCWGSSRERCAISRAPGTTAWPSTWAPPRSERS